jgi:hypothetical protein
VQYILYRTEPSTARPGKLDKVPLDWRSLRTASPLDSAVQADRATIAAVAAACGPAFGVGLVIQPPLWFIDIDNALLPSGWSPVAVELCERLAGAYVEVSVSGTGLHILGSGAVPPHVCRNAALGLELYSGARFCALTGTHAQGDMSADLTAAISAVAARYFPPGAAALTGSTAWTDGPCDGYAGPADDDALIERMLAARPGASATFGGRASLRDLWTGDADALSHSYPDAVRAFDASRADAALAQHLAFWTGRDCERIQRLMLRSGLVRDKWEREDYLQRTVLTAVAQQREVYAQPQAQAVAPAAPPGTVGGILTASDLPRHFKNCVYIEDRYEVAVPDGSLLTAQQFRASNRYGGHTFILSDTGKTTRSAWEAFTESEVFRPAWAHGVCFRPELPSRALIEDGGRMLFNSYVPVPVLAVAGDVGPILRHLERLLPHRRDRDILLAYMASLVQNPGVKFQWWPLLQGCEGNGKTILLRLLAYCVGERYTHFPSAQDLANKFNGWLDRKLFIGIEEIYVSERRDMLDTLKVYITNDRIEIQFKGRDQVTADNRANGILCTNHKDAVPKTENDRRYCVFYTAQQEAADLERDGMTGRYFPDLWDWFRSGGAAAFCHYLRTYRIPAALDPARDCHRAPRTSTTDEAVSASLGPNEQAVIEAVGDGRPGFCGDFVSSHFLGLLLKGRRCPPNSWDAMLRALGYVKHPALPSGRVNAPVAPDGCKPRLWVRVGSPAAAAATGAEVAARYQAANVGLAGS